MKPCEQIPQLAKVSIVLGEQKGGAGKDANRRRNGFSYEADAEPLRKLLYRICRHFDLNAQWVSGRQGEPEVIQISR